MYSKYSWLGVKLIWQRNKQPGDTWEIEVDNNCKPQLRIGFGLKYKIC